MGDFRTLSKKEVDALFSKSEKQAYKIGGHTFVNLKGAGKQVCTGCGLVALRNKPTDCCVTKGCNYKDHSSYSSVVKRLVGGLKRK